MSTPAPVSPALYLRDLGVPVTVNRIGLTGSGLLTSLPGLLIAATMANNSTTTPVWVALGDGTDANGMIIASLAAPAGGGIAFTPGLPGVPFSRGLYVTHHAGMYDLTVTFIRADSIP